MTSSRRKNSEGMFKERNQIEIKGGKKRTATSSPEKDINKTASVSTQHSDRETPSGQNKKKGTKSSQDADRRRFAKIAMKRGWGHGTEANTAPHHN